MKSEDFDRALDGALAIYVAAEPRAGLEQRVLANLRAQGKREAGRAWRLPAAALGMALVITAILGWHADNRGDVIPVHKVARQTTHSIESREAAGVANATRAGLVERHVRERGLRRNRAVTSALPRLDQFPAPEPLSEQEKLLIRFVEDDPQGAALVAQATAEELKRESDGVQDSEPQ